MNSAHSMAYGFLCFAVFSMTAGVCSDAGAENISAKSTDSDVRTPIRQDKAHPAIVHWQEYPVESRHRGEEGSCLVRLEVGPDGLAHARQLLITTGFARLDAACATAFADAQFIPATLNGKPVANWVDLPVDWKLERGVTHAQMTFAEDQPAVPIIQKDYELRAGPKFYPATSRTQHQEGDCAIQVLIKADGTVGDIRVGRSTGFATLDQACVLAVQQASFVPAQRNGTPVDAWAEIMMSWRLPAK